MEQIVERLLALPPKELLGISIGIGVVIGIIWCAAIESAIHLINKYIHIG